MRGLLNRKITVEAQGKIYRMRPVSARYQLGEIALRQRARKALEAYPLKGEPLEALSHNCALVAYGLGWSLPRLLNRLSLEEIAQLAWAYHQAGGEVHYDGWGL